VRLAAGALLVVAVATAGCAEMQHALSPAPAAPPTRTAAVPAPAPAPRPALPATPLPAPSAPAPLPKPPPVPSPPRPVPSPMPTLPPAPSPRVLSPQLEDEEGIERQAQGRIEGTERLMEKIDQRKLAGDQHQNLSTIQSFVAKAKEALTARDVQRAFTLADKAYRLAEELSRTTQ
jgi:hypothetical protein